MWLVLAALRRPLTVLVAVLAIVLSAGLAVRRAPVDIFPNLGVPVVYVVQPFAGMSPGQMESQLVNYYEYHFLYVSGIEHIESQSIQGMAMLKLYFHPGTDIAQALAQVTAMAFRSTSFMPPGTLPPFIVRFDAGSIPVGQLVFSSESRSEQEIQDLALYRVRPLLATLPGVSSPPPSGGKVRTIVVYADPERMRAYRLSPNDIAVTLARENLTLPAGNIRVGDLIPITTTNATVRKIADLENIPLRTGAGPTVFLRDVARVADDADIVYNIALVNGHRTVYMPVTKRADASTLDVVNGVKAALPQMRALVPEDLHISLEFDQSVYVTGSIRGLITEGALGAALTGLMVLLFLGDWRSALIVVLTIPFSVLASVVGLRLVGQTINIMTLGGLALAIGILVDEATVAIENIHTHLSQAKKAGRAVVDAMREVMMPRLLAMLCVLAVFIPSLAMVGIGRALFPPLALAVAFSMVASYFLSSTLVPVLAVWLFRTARVRPHEAGGLMARLQDRYGRAWAGLLARRRLLVLGYAAVCAGALLLAGQLGTELFPRTDAGQFQLRVRAPAGTRLEKTEEVVRSVDQLIRDEVGPQLVNITLANIGNPAWSFPVNGVYVWNAGPQEALLLVSLKEGRRPSLAVLQERLRQKLSAAWPEVKFSFEAGDIVSQVMNFGSATPVSVTVSGSDLAAVRSFTEKLAAQMRLLPSLRDVQIPQPLDYPTLDVEIDRERAGQLGVTVDTVGRSLVGATSSSVLTTPNFFIDPKSGVPYRVALRVPENLLRSADDLRNLPVMPDGAPRPLLADVATVTPGRAFGEIDHRNSQRTLSVSANVAGRDLKQAQTDVARAVASMGAPPRGLKVAIHGQIEQMETTLASLREGLIFAIGVVLLLLSANFQSLRAALLVLSTVPAVLAGVVIALYVTGSTLNVQSMMGAIMSIGVAVANAVLVITFARERRRQGDSPAVAAVQAARSRLRPVLMTSLAMIAGMIPMALGLGEGGEQSAPLGRAVIGGLAAATMATLFVLPAIYALGESAGRYRSASLDPNDPESSDFEQATS
ncbi:MAG TPA: efflux RND transporter permease subunit [Pseudomonadota bacterium]|nr:efflux RND transporter permease subunit [Pseudomonadota bacterium]HRI48775.1 efflux RND transporter permease subunit [Pseudomonadota bacterium]